MKHYFLIFLLILTREIDYVKGQNQIYCDNDAQCLHIIEFSECRNQKCVCRRGEVLSSDGSKCLKPARGFEDPCEDNTQCSEVLGSGGVCENKECKCKRDFHYFKGSCWRNVNLNEQCWKDEQCFAAYEYVGLECTDGICQCRHNYYERLNSGCRRKMRDMEDCNLDSDCPEGVLCQNMKCTPPVSAVAPFTFEEYSETYPGGYGSMSLRFVSELGDKCTSDGECKVKNSVCLDRKLCGCKPPKYVASENNRRCLPTSRGKVNDIKKSSCEENVQCAVFGGNSICKDRKCACKNDTYWEVKNQFCWPIKYVGEKCEVAEDCHPSGTFAECDNKVCQCQRGYHEKGRICVRDATDVGDYCEVNQDCLFPNSFCSEINVCACKENFYVLNGKCSPGVRSKCNSDADCYHLNNTSCRSSTCSSSLQCLCFDNHVSSDAGTYCLPAAKYGEECEEDFQCRSNLGEFGECKNGVCQCKNTTHYSHGKCYRSKFMKESCSRLQDCHPGNDGNSVICLNGFCSCNYGYEQDGFGLCVKTSSAAVMKPYLYLILAAFFSLRQR